MSNSLWERIEPLLRTVERPSRYINHEYGILLHPDAQYHCVFIYPDTYEIGQSNQGLAILYRIINDLPDFSAERAYLPWIDMLDVMREHAIPLFSLETYTPIREFDLIGFTLPHELACTNVLESLDLAGLPLLAADRGDDAPLVIAGGPCTYNPEPFARFFDAFIIGEGEEVIQEFVLLHRKLRDKGVSKHELLHELAQITGVYVPRFYQQESPGSDTIIPLDSSVPAVIQKRVFASFAQQALSHEQIVPFAEVTHDRFNVEVLRGCTRGCRFCQAGMIYRPVREHSSDQIVAAVMQGLACTGYDEVSLTSLSTTDHSQLESILRRLNSRLEETGISISIPSQRVDAFGVQMAELVAGSKKGGLTFAPEAGTQRLRDIINKNITEEDLISAIQHAFEAGWRRTKLYFMCGLPEETDEDLVGIGKLVGRAYRAAKDAVPDNERGSVRMSVSCAVFVPKTHTPFQWYGQIPPKEVERRIRVIRDAIPGKGIDFHWHDSRTSFIEGVISRGGREVGALIMRAWEKGARFDAWNERFSYAHWEEAATELGISMATISSREFTIGEPLPWQHISAGVSWDYLKQEYERARKGKTTPDCSFSGCTGCGLCSSLDCSVELAGERLG